MFAASKSGISTGGGGSSVVTDPQFNYVVALLNGDGTNGAQNNSFIDSSTNSATITAFGNATQGSFTPYGGTWSNYFPGSSYFTTAASATHQLTGNFTIECWAYATSVGTQQGLVNITNTASSGANGLSLYFDTSNKVTFYVNGNTTVTSSAINAVTANTWYHIALVRNSTTNTLYINGTSAATSTTTPTWPATPSIGIGRIYNDNTGVTLNGYISNVRIVKGTAVYTANFTPPTTPLTAVTNTYLLTCQSNRFIDNSSNAISLATVTGTPKAQKFTPFSSTTSPAYTIAQNGGSVYFDGSGDYLQTSTYNANLNPSSSDFTIEFWVYATASSRQDWFNLQAASGTNRILVYYTGSAIQYDAGVGSAAASKISSTLASTSLLNQWHHVALSRASGSSKLFLDGVQIGSTFADTQVWTNALQFTTGKDPGGSTQVTGYISNIRYLVGTGLYTANFTPPTTPLTNITNTQLLVNATNAGTYDSSMKSNFETVGNAQVSTSVKKYGTGSLAFDGTLDSVTAIDNPNINFGTGDFTLECWAYFNVVNAEMCLINKGWQSTPSFASYLIYMTSAGSLRFNASSAGASWDVASEKVIGTMTAATWTHIAVTRSGTTFRAFVNGTIVSAFTFTSATTLLNSATQALYIGGRSNGTSSMNGYLDDVRITKGYARYTANFTPPTAALPTS